MLFLLSPSNTHFRGSEEGGDEFVQRMPGGPLCFLFMDQDDPQTSSRRPEPKESGADLRRSDIIVLTFIQQQKLSQSDATLDPEVRTKLLSQDGQGIVRGVLKNDHVLSETQVNDYRRTQLHWFLASICFKRMSYHTKWLWNAVSSVSGDNRGTGEGVRTSRHRDRARVVG